MPEPIGLFAPHVIANGEGYNRDNIIAACDRVGGRHVVFVNDWEACRDWLGRGGIAAHRVLTSQYNDDDADAHFDAAEYVDHVNHELNVAESNLPQQSRKRGVVYLGNELGTGTAARTDAWGEKGVSRATFHGRKVVFGNWAFKNKPPALPKTIAALRRNGGWMGFHEGTYGNKPLAPDAFADGAIGGFIAWKQQYSVPCWITEFAGSATAHDGWKVLYNNDWRKWATQIEWSLEHVYEPNNTPVSEFTLPKWNVGRGFEFIDVPEFLDELARLNRSYVYMSNPTVPPPTTDGTLIRITGLPQGVPHRNIRLQPTASDDNDVGDLRVGDVVTAYLSAQTQDAWCYVRRLSDGVEGWTLFAGVVYETVPPPTTDIAMTREQYRELQAISAQIANAGQRLATLIEEVAPPSAPGGTF